MAEVVGLGPALLVALTSKYPEVFNINLERGRLQIRTCDRRGIKAQFRLDAAQLAYLANLRERGD